MIRTHWMQSAAAAKAYYRSSDYYATTPGEWLGKGAALLGLTGEARAEDFDKLADNLHPHTGEPLTTYTRDGRRVGLDMTFNATKSVSIAREMAGLEGDGRIEDAHREAVGYTLGLIETDMQARVRAGGANGNRTTGNLVAYRVTHRDTRINADDQRPDPQLHDHVFIMNATYDPVEEKWKAAEIGQIKQDANYYEAVYMNRLASNLKELGYGIRRDKRAFEIAGIDRPLIEKFSRRTAYIEKVAGRLGIEKPETKAKLGATTRLGKAKETTDDLRAYYVSRLTEAEKRQLGCLVGQPSYQSTDEKAVRFAVGHIYERQSVAAERKVYETALRHGVGSVTPEGVEREARRQGLLVKDRDATTRAVLAEESRIIALAREGKSMMRPMQQNKGKSRDTATALGAGQEESRPDGSERPLVSQIPSPLRGKGDTATLSAEQQALVSHVLRSPDQMILVVGDAGTGKTHAIKAAFREIDRPVEMLAPSAAASRGVLRDEGFAKADTVASFLLDENRQRAVKGGVVWVDEAGLLPIRDLSKLVDVARNFGARIVLQGDPKQHRSPARHGDMMNVLQEYAGLPVGRLTEVWRQKHQGYKAAVESIAGGKILEGFDRLDGMGWAAARSELAGDYMDALATAKPGQKDRVIVVAPTHAEGDEITAEIRARLKDAGKIGREDAEIERLVPLNWTDAEKGDLMDRIEGSEVLVFHRNSGTFKAGDVVKVTQWPRGGRYKSAGHFSVYRREKIGLAKGDQIRLTGRVKDVHGNKLDNGTQLTVTGVSDKGIEAVTQKGAVRVLPLDAGHVSYGYVSTSHAAQGRTADRVLVAMGPSAAVSAEQFYVSVSRGRFMAKIYTDHKDELREMIRRADERRSATELMGQPERLGALATLLRRARERFKQLRQRAANDNSKAKERERQYGYER